MRRRRGPIVAGIAITLLALGFGAFQARDPSDDADAPADLVGDVAGIRQALDRLVVLLDDVRLQQEVELLLRRIEIKERRIAPLEGRVRDAENVVESLRSAIRHVEIEREQKEAEREDALAVGTEEADRNRQELKELEAYAEATAEQLRDSEARLRQWEDRLAEEREAIDRLDARVEELLEGW